MSKPKPLKTENIVERLNIILQSGTAGTQEDIKYALEKQGYEINQSKISRLLRKVGAMKMTIENGQTVYALPQEPTLPNTKNVLAPLIISMAHNETLIVIATNPGSASLIARYLDHHRQELAILGTVAGDDTLFVAPKSAKKLPYTLRLIRTFLEKAS